MKKRLLLLLFAILSLLPGYAYDFKVDGIYYDIIDGECIVTSGPIYVGDIVIPASVTYNGQQYPVTAIGNRAFSYSEPTSVTIPNSVISIGEEAFCKCKGLTSVVIPNSVTSIGEGAFGDCSGLTSAVIPNSVISIGDYAFASSGLTSVVIPNSVTSIGEGTFLYCKELTSVVIPNSVTSIGEEAFCKCKGLTSVTFPNSVTDIRNRAFEGCSGLISVTIPNSVTSIGDGAFYGCSSLSSVNISDLEAWCNIEFSNWSSNPVYFAHHLYLNGEEIKDLVIPPSIKAIREFAFEYCSGLNSVTIPNSVTSIGNKAFSNCSGLTGKLTIPNSVISIGNNAFYNCTGLTSVIIGNSVTSIGPAAFELCSGLTSITIPPSVTSIDQGFYGCSNLSAVNISDLKAWCNIEFKTSVFANPLLYAHHLYLNGKEIKNLVIPNTITAIGNYAFIGASGLTSVIIPSSVISIGDEAFDDCDRLLKNAYPSGISNPFSSGISIEYPAEGAVFEDGIIYGSNKEKIYFASLDYEREYTIPNTVTEIGEWAFYDCEGLTSITIPTSLTSIDPQAFRRCINLNAVYISDLEAWCNINFDIFSNPTSNYAHLYLNGEEIKDLVIPASVTAIGDEAFSGCIGLSSVTIPSSVTSIGNRSFSECTGITSVTIPSSVISIGGAAFWGCTGLISAIIPGSVTSIGYSAFNHCPELKSIKVDAQVPPTAYGNTFEEQCYQTATLYVPEESVEAYKSQEPWSWFRNIDITENYSPSVDPDDPDNPESGLEEVDGIDSGAVEVYNLNGFKVGESLDGLPKGVYIVRQGAQISKIAI